MINYADVNLRSRIFKQLDSQALSRLLEPLGDVSIHTASVAVASASIRKHYLTAHLHADLRAATQETI